MDMARRAFIGGLRRKSGMVLAGARRFASGAPGAVLAWAPISPSRVRRRLVTEPVHLDSRLPSGNHRFRVRGWWFLCRESPEANPRDSRWPITRDRRV